MRFDYVFDGLRATSEPRDEVEQMLGALDAVLPAEVSVVGNAASLLALRHGAAIDRFPTVRFNAAQVVDAAAQGERWDFVATSNAKVLGYYRQHEPQFHHLLFTPYLNTHVRDLTQIGSERPVLRLPVRMSRELSWRCLARPTTGMQVLTLCERLKRRVHLFGFDWKATPTFNTKTTRDPHDHARERELALAMIERNGWTVYR